MNILQMYNSFKKFDALCLSETYIDSTGSSDDESLEISDYILVRADHPSSSKRGSVCIFYHNSLLLKVLDIHYLQECINLK